MKRLEPVIIAIIIIGVLLGFIVGYGIGYTTGLNWCVNKGLEFIELKGIDIEINEALLKEGIIRYKNKIDLWLK